MCDEPKMAFRRSTWFAEKFRVAMTRREVAIRDFYDIDYAIRTLGIQVDMMACTHRGA